MIISTTVALWGIIIIIITIIIIMIMIIIFLQGCLESLLCEAGAVGARQGGISLLVTEVDFSLS